MDTTNQLKDKSKKIKSITSNSIKLDEVKKIRNGSKSMENNSIDEQTPKNKMISSHKSVLDSQRRVGLAYHFEISLFVVVINPSICWRSSLKGTKPSELINKSD